jgi:hypothetical protein
VMLTRWYGGMVMLQDIFKLIEGGREK